MKQAAILVFLLSAIGGYAQQDTLNSRRLLILSAAAGVTYGGLLVALNEFWYKEYPRSGFHFFNDNSGWLQQDKAGHVFTSATLGLKGMEAMRWTGAGEKKAAWIGGLGGSLFLTTIELLDAFSSQWGFSAGDFAANSAGSAMVMVQQLAWREQRVLLKYSFHTVLYPAYAEARATSIYGNNLPEKLFKDYNGQTFWLTGNLSSFGIHAPRWLDISIGYSAEGMLGARSNLVEQDDVVIEDYSAIPRLRQWFLSPDINLGRIKSRSALIRTTLGLLNIMKFPAPALELRSNGELKLHAVYF